MSKIQEAAVTTPMFIPAKGATMDVNVDDVPYLRQQYGALTPTEAARKAAAESASADAPKSSKPFKSKTEKEAAGAGEAGTDAPPANGATASTPS